MLMVFSTSGAVAIKIKGNLQIPSFTLSIFNKISDLEYKKVILKATAGKQAKRANTANQYLMSNINKL